MLRWFRQRSNDRRRNIDLDHAKAAFATHALHDEAWRALGEPEIIRRIEAVV